MSTLMKFMPSSHMEMSYFNNSAAYLNTKDSFETDYATQYNNGPFLGLANGINTTSSPPSSISSISSATCDSNTNIDNSTGTGSINANKNNSTNSSSSSSTKKYNNNKNYLVEEKNDDHNTPKQSESIALYNQNNNLENKVQYTNMSKREDYYNQIANDAPLPPNLSEAICQMEQQQHQQQSLNQQQLQQDFNQFNYYSIAQNSHHNRRNTYQHNIDPTVLQPLQSVSSSLMSPNSLNTPLSSIPSDIYKTEENGNYLKGYSNVLYSDPIGYPNPHDERLLTQLTGNREQIHQSNMINYIPDQFAKMINIHGRNITSEVTNHKEAIVESISNEIAKNASNINQHHHHHHQIVANLSSSSSSSSNTNNNINDSNAHNVHSSSTRSHSKSNSSNNLSLNDHELINLPLRELNKRLRNLSKPQASELKRRRRTLKNRKYAQNCRSKRLEQKNDMEIQNHKLKAELNELKKQLEKIKAEYQTYQELLFKDPSIKDQLKLYSNSNQNQRISSINHQNNLLNNHSMITSTKSTNNYE